jgi:hypothetical protein
MCVCVDCIDSKWIIKCCMFLPILIVQDLTSVLHWNSAQATVSEVFQKDRLSHHSGKPASLLCLSWHVLIRPC